MKKLAANLVAALLAAILCSACCTQALWQNVNPAERVWIPAGSVTEETLIRKGVAYQKFDREDPKGYLVKKSSLRKLGEYTLLTLATPITVAVDGTMTAVYLLAQFRGAGLR